MNLRTTVIVFYLSFLFKLSGQTLPYKSQCVFWLKADSLVSLSGTDVNNWISSENISYTLTPVGLPPNQTISSKLNNNNVISFNNSQMHISPTFNSDSGSFFLVFYPNGFSTSIKSIFSNSILNNQIFVYTPFSIRYTNGGSNQRDYDNSLIDDFQIISNVYNFKLGQMDLNVNSIPKASTFAGNPIKFIFDQMGNSNFNGSIAEVIFFNKVCNSSERQNIENYLFNKYAPPIKLPSDINISNKVCDTVISHSGYFTNYQWSNGATTPTISVNQSGKYWVNATNIFGKVSSDTILVTYPSYQKPTTNLICTGNQLKWDAGLSKSEYSFQWQDNSTDSIYNITQAGKYYVKITDNFGCNITSDTLKVTEDNYPNIASLGTDLSLCSGNTISLTSGANQTNAYLWNDGSTNSSLTITNSGTYSVIATNTNNCVAKDTINVTIIGDAPNTNFNSSIGCKKQTMSFSDLSIIPNGNSVSNVLWNFGEPLSSLNTSTLNNTYHTFADTGYYNVSLSISTNVGCEKTITKNIHVTNTSTLSIIDYNKPNQNIVCSNDSLIWNTNQLKSNYTFNWQDNSADSLLTIKQPGKYYAQITDVFGCTFTTDTLNIEIDNFPAIPSLGPDVSLCSGNSIALTTGSLAATSYTWSDNSHNNSLQINASGQYSVVVTNTNNCVAKDTINVTVLGQAPTANFSSSIGCKNNAVSFTNLSSPPLSNTITNTIWNFGDVLSSSNTSTLSNPFHTYNDTGFYQITLRVITNTSCEQSVTKTIHIAPSPTVNFSNGLSCQNDSTTFTNSTSNTVGYPIINYKWNFGDVASGSANTSSLTNPKHVFGSQTNYAVKLVATNNAGCKDSLTNIINVKAQVSANFTNTPPCLNSPTIFQDNSIVPSPSTSSSRVWNFGSSTANGVTVSKTFTNTGVYNISLTVNGSNGCVSSVSKLINVFLPPTTNFTVPSICAKDTITISNLSLAQSGILSSFNWKLNSTSFSSAQNPTLTVPNSGTYSVQLVAANSFGCKDSVSKTINVLSLPNVDFTTNPSTYYYINSPISFIPSITNAVSYLWSISNFTNTIIQSPTVTINTEGTYTVNLLLKDNTGCKNSKTKNILISKPYLDIAILNVNTTKDNDGFLTVESDIANYGTLPVNSIKFYYKITDGPNTKEVWNGTLNPNSFFTYTYNSNSPVQRNNSNNIICVTLDKANGVDDQITENNYLCNTLYTDDFSVSNPIPNPTDGDITLPIILNKEIDYKIYIYNSTGGLQYEAESVKGSVGINFVTLQTSSYSKGCYIIKTQIDDKVFIKKFIVIRND
jgi:PKD repeat protein